MILYERERERHTQHQMLYCVYSQFHGIPNVFFYLFRQKFSSYNIPWTQIELWKSGWIFVIQQTVYSIQLYYMMRTLYYTKINICIFRCYTTIHTFNYCWAWARLSCYQSWSNTFLQKYRSNSLTHTDIHVNFLHEMKITVKNEWKLWYLLYTVLEFMLWNSFWIEYMEYIFIEVRTQLPKSVCHS